MSILANLLKKNNPQQEAGQIPPGLLQSVSNGPSSGTKRRVYLPVVLVAVVVVAGGALLVLYLQTRVPSQPLVVRPSQSQMQQAVVAPVPVPQQQQSSARVVAVPGSAKTTMVKQVATVPDTPQQHQARATKHNSASASALPVPAVERKPVLKDRATLDAYLFAARSAEARRDYSQAMQQYRKALEVDPQNYRVLNNIASTSLTLGMYQDALGFASRALQLKGDYVSALVNAGIAHGKLGNESGARAMLGRAVLVDPANRSALYNLALSQERSAAWDESLNSYRRLADTGDAQGVLGMARVKERRGDRFDALRLYREVTSHPDAGQRLKDLARERIGVLDR